MEMGRRENPYFTSDHLKCPKFMLLCASRPEFDVPRHNVFEKQNAQNLTIVSMLEDDEFDEESQEKAVQYLNCFGETVTKLKIQFQLQNFGRLLDAIVDNCSDKLVALKFDDFTDEGDIPYMTNDMFKFRSFIQNLNTRFPNLQHLEIEQHNGMESHSYWDDIVAAMPMLKHLTINGISPQIAIQFVQLNPQIRSLSILNDLVKGCCMPGNCEHPKSVHKHDKLPANCFEWLDNLLPELEHLSVNVGSVSKMSTINDEVSNVYLKNLKSFVCEGYGNGFWEPNLMLLASSNVEHLEFNYFADNEIDPIAELLTRFVNLKRLSVNVFGEAKKNMFFMIWREESLRDFILSKPQLSKITIRSKYCVTGDEDDGAYYAVKDQEPSGNFWMTPYRSFVHKELNGSKWNVRADAYKVELFKLKGE